MRGLSYLRTISRVPVVFLRWAWRFLKAIRFLVLSVLLVASLSLNVASVAFSSVAVAMSMAYEAVTGARSVTGKLRDQIQSEKRTATVLGKQVASKERRIASLSAEVKQLKTPRVVSFRGKKKMLSEVVEETTSHISVRMAKGASLNLGSAAAEAIPIAGIVAMLGVTAWDLKSSCDTMRDMHDLNLAFNPTSEADPNIAEVCGKRVPTRGELWAAVKTSPHKAWGSAKDLMPDLPEYHMPSIDWSFWN
ncbi:hypothetical protein [Thioclava sp.]|uniref:hypothetical protein n=1 Tax=Thioclava sp. TaxID=1933450 RepID=UPI003AA82F27